MLKKESFIFKHQDLVAFLCFAATAVLLCWRAPYSFGEDDALYLYIPQRLMQGDSLLFDEWHVSQFSTLFVWLPTKIYIGIMGSTEGIILASRYYFIFCQAIISIVLYRFFREYGIYSVIATIIYFLHIPLSVTLALWYTSLTLEFMLLILLLMFSNMKRFTRAKLVIIGILFSFAVLCNLYLALLFLAYSFMVLIFKFVPEITVKSKQTQQPVAGRRYKAISKMKVKINHLRKCFAARPWLWISVGVVFTASVFFAFLLSRASIKDLIKSIPMMLTFPEEFDLSNPSSIFSVSRTLGIIYNLNPVLFVLCCAICLSLLIDAQRIRHRSAYLAGSVVVFLSYLVVISLNDQVYYYSPYMYPMILLGLVSYILTEKKNKRLFFGYLWGIITGVFIDISSTGGFYLANTGLTISDVMSVFIIGNLISEIRSQPKENLANKTKKLMEVMRKISIPALCIAFAAQIGLMVYVAVDLKTTAFEYLYEDKSNELSVTLDKGPEKGCITTPLKAEQYYRTLNDLAMIKQWDKKPILFADNMIWAYLYLDFPYGTYTAYQYAAEFEKNFYKIMYYYEMNPSHSPDYIYIPKPIYTFSVDKLPYTDETVRELFGLFSQEFEFTVQEGDAGYILKDVTKKI